MRSFVKADNTMQLQFFGGILCLLLSGGSANARLDYSSPIVGARFDQNQIRLRMSRRLADNYVCDMLSIPFEHSERQKSRVSYAAESMF